MSGFPTRVPQDFGPARRLAAALREGRLEDVLSPQSKTLQ